MDEKFSSQKWFLVLFIVAAIFLASNSVLDSCWLVGLTDDRIQFGDYQSSALLYVLGWAAPVTALLISTKLASRLRQLKKVKIAFRIYVTLAAFFSVWYGLRFWYFEPPVAVLNYELGGQLLAYEALGFLGDTATIIERKKLISPNVFWIHMLHIEPESCEVSMTLLPSNTVKCIFVTGFWRRAPYLEVVLKF